MLTTSTPVIARPVIAEVFWLLSEASGRAYASGLTRGRAPMGAIGAIRACADADRVPPDRENEVGLQVAEEIGKLLDAIGWSWGGTQTVTDGRLIWFRDAPADMGGRDGDAAKMLAEEAEPGERNGRLLAADALCDLFDALGATDHAEGWREGTADAWRTWQASDKGSTARKALWSSWLSPVDNDVPVMGYAYSSTVGGETRTHFATPERAPTVHRAVAEAVIRRWHRRRPAVARTVAVGQLIEAASGAIQRELSGMQSRRVMNGRRQVGEISATADLTDIWNGVALMDRVWAQRALKVIVLRAHEAVTRGATTPDIHFRGLSGLAEEIGYGDGKLDDLRDFLNALEQIQWQNEYFEKGMPLLAWSLSKAAPGRPAVLTIRAGDVLAPDFRLLQSNNRAARVARRLVPELRYDPPVGFLRSNEQGAGWIASRRLVVAMVDDAELLATAGSIPIDDARWDAIAGKLRRKVSDLRDHWLEGEGADAPPLIQRAGNGYTLAEAHRPELDFIIEAGKARIAGRKRSELGKAKRRNG